MNPSQVIRLLKEATPYVNKVIAVEGEHSDVSRDLVEMLQAIPTITEKTKEALLRHYLQAARACCFFCFNHDSHEDAGKFEEKTVYEKLYDRITSALHQVGHFEKLPKFAFA